MVRGWNTRRILISKGNNVLITVDASNGGGLVPPEEVAQALGAFWLRMSGFLEVGGQLSESVNIIDDGEREETVYFTWKGRMYRATEFRDYEPHCNTVKKTTRFHFDYIRQADEGR